MNFNTLTEIAIYLVNSHNSDEYRQIQEQLNYELNEGVFQDQATDASKLTHKLIAASADRAKVIAIVNGYGDAVDWNYHSLDSIIAEVWQSDLNSGDEPDSWIINEICRTFNIEEVTE